jgi:2-polyprenyl-3-methyl-5-hydroxy-6-metoxy-1,4-benzoquinol methylase
MAHSCPLCQSTRLKSYFENKGAIYLSCSECGLVFTPKEFHLSDIDEKIRYDSHQNNPKDQRYRQFLSQVFNPVMECIQPGNTGLDFGCGPGPTLSIMFEEQGYKVDLFDKFYADDQSIFDNRYDFITATEVVEHLAKPGDELNRLYKMLNTGGTLAIMTKMINDQTDFASWYYKDDPTHICFFSQQTMEYLAKTWSSRVQFYGHDITLFFK